MSMLGADSCIVQWRKPGSTSLPDWRSRLLLSATLCHVDVRLACVKPQELTEKGTSGSFHQGGEIKLSRKRRGALWKEIITDTFVGLLKQVSTEICLLTCLFF